MTVLVRLAPIALAVLLLAALCAAPASASHTRGKCTQRGKTVAKNDSGRVFRRESSLGARSLYGCLWSRNRAVLLEAAYDDFYESQDWSRVQLRGRFVSWVYTTTDDSCKADCPPGYDTTREYVNRFDLRSEDRDLHGVDLDRGPFLNTRGALAWSEYGDGGSKDVHAWDRDGHRVVDQGAISLLRLRGSLLSWSNGDEPRSLMLR